MSEQAAHEAQQKTLLVFDFDNTLIQDNTDTRPFDLLAPDILDSHFRNKQLYRTLGWTGLVNTSLEILSNRGITVSTILSAVSTSPFPEPHVQLITRISRSPLTEAAIVSDANQHYIDACLSAHDLGTSDFSAGVFTNLSEVIESRLVVTPFTNVHGAHECSNCPSNLCKSVVLNQLLKQRPGVNVIYVGDGSNDYCPAVSLPSHALVLPRGGYPLEKRILKRPIAANVRVWWNPAELVAIVGEHVPALR